MLHYSVRIDFYSVMLPRRDGCNIGGRPLIARIRKVYIDNEKVYEDKIRPWNAGKKDHDAIEEFEDFLGKFEITKNACKNATSGKNLLERIRQYFDKKI